MSSANPPPALKRPEFPTELFSLQLFFFGLGRNPGDHFWLHPVDDFRAKHPRYGGEEHYFGDKSGNIIDEQLHGNLLKCEISGMLMRQGG